MHGRKIVPPVVKGFFYVKKNREAIFFGVDRAAVRRSRRRRRAAELAGTANAELAGTASAEPAGTSNAELSVRGAQNCCRLFLLGGFVSRSRDDTFCNTPLMVSRNSS